MLVSDLWDGGSKSFSLPELFSPVPKSSHQALQKCYNYITFLLEVLTYVKINYKIHSCRSGFCVRPQPKRNTKEIKRRTKQMNRKTVEAVHTHTHTHTHQSITKQNWWTVWRESIQFNR